jgi:hypothetical protein
MLTGVALALIQQAHLLRRPRRVHTPSDSGVLVRCARWRTGLHDHMRNLAMVEVRPGAGDHIADAIINPEFDG